MRRDLSYPRHGVLGDQKQTEDHPKLLRTQKSQLTKDTYAPIALVPKDRGEGLWALKGAHQRVWQSKRQGERCGEMQGKTTMAWRPL